MTDAPFTDDLELDEVRTRDDLAARLGTVHIRSDKPSLRVLEAKTRHSASPLSKTVVSDMLKGRRFPRKAVMVAFLRACGVPEDAIEPWRRAWDRLADPEAAAHARATQTFPGWQPPTGTADGSQAQDVSVSQPPDTPAGADEAERVRLRQQVSQLTVYNESLRIQLEQKSTAFPSETSPGRDIKATIDYVMPHGHMVHYFEIKDSEQLFYDELAEHVRNAKDAVYIQGTGFHDERKSPVYMALMNAEQEALRRGAEVIRVQHGTQVAPGWAEGYAGMIEEFDRFHMYADLDAESYYDVILIDPLGHHPVAGFLFEARDRRPHDPVSKPVTALFVMNAPALATNLTDHFIDHIGELTGLDSQDVRDLASTSTYFAWGVHMLADEMRRDVPDAVRLGKATLYGWLRNIDGILSGPANRDTIEKTGRRKDAIQGIAYELSWRGKAKLERREQRAYEEVEITIEQNRKERAAFFYVPLPKATEKLEPTRGSWIESVAKGARDNRIRGLSTQLRKAGVQIDEGRT